MADSIPSNLSLITHHLSPQKLGKLKEPGEIKQAVILNPIQGSLCSQAGITALRRPLSVLISSQKNPPANPGSGFAELTELLPLPALFSSMK